MNKESLINDYFDGNLDSSNQEILFSELTNSEEMRYAFNQLFALKLAISKDITAFVPTSDTTNTLFAKLGISAIPSENNSFGLFFSKYGKQFLTSAFTCLATVLVMLWLFPKGNSTHINNKYNKDIPLVSSSEKVQKNSVSRPATDANSYKYDNEISLLKFDNNKLYGLVNSLTNENNLLKSQNNNLNKALAIINDKLDNINSKSHSLQQLSPEKQEEYASVFQSNFVSNNNPNSINSFTPNFIYLNSGEAGNNKTLRLEASVGRYFQSIGKGFIDRNNTFTDNLRINGLYNLSNEFALGIDLRQENFYQEFTGVTNKGEEILYQQQPTVYSGSLLFRYYPEYLNYYQFNPSLELSIGISNIGELARIGVGFDYYLLGNTYFYLKSDYSFLSFYHKNINFSSSKIGTHIGLGVEF